MIYFWLFRKLKLIKIQYIIWYNNIIFPTGQRADPVQNPKAFQDLDHVQDLKADLVADQDPAPPGLDHDPVPDQDPGLGTLDPKHQSLESPCLQVKTKLRLSCKYLSFSYAPELTYNVRVKFILVWFMWMRMYFKNM